MIDCYVDADWAGDAMDRKSTTGYVIRMYENVIYWKTRKQSGWMGEEGERIVRPAKPTRRYGWRNAGVHADGAYGAAECG